MSDTRKWSVFEKEINGTLQIFNNLTRVKILRNAINNKHFIRLVYHPKMQPSGCYILRKKSICEEFAVITDMLVEWNSSVLQALLYSRLYRCYCKDDYPGDINRQLASCIRRNNSDTFALLITLPEIAKHMQTRIRIGSYDFDDRKPIILPNIFHPVLPQSPFIRQLIAAGHYTSLDVFYSIISDLFTAPPSTLTIEWATNVWAGLCVSGLGFIHPDSLIHLELVKTAKSLLANDTIWWNLTFGGERLLIDKALFTQFAIQHRTVASTYNKSEKMTIMLYKAEEQRRRRMLANATVDAIRNELILVCHDRISGTVL